MKTLPELLRRIIDETKMLTREEWAEVLSVSPKQLADWVLGLTMPTPRALRAIGDIVDRDLRFPQQEWKDLMNAPLQDVYPEASWEVRKEVGQNLGSYALKDMRQAFLERLESLLPEEQEQVIYEMSGVIRRRLRNLPPSKEELKSIAQEASKLVDEMKADRDPK